jgi:hypothetical protein
MSEAPSSKRPGQSTRPVNVERRDLTPEQLQHIGQLLVSTSDLDDLLSLLIFQLSDFVEPHTGYIVLGRLPVSDKVKRAEKLVKRFTDKQFQELFEHLKLSLSNMFRYRNAFAHGIYQGVNPDDGSLQFVLTHDDLWDPEGGFDAHIGIGILPKDLKDMAAEAQALVGTLETWWELKDWRAERYQQSHAVIPRGQRPRRG